MILPVTGQSDAWTPGQLAAFPNARKLTYTSYTDWVASNYILLADALDVEAAYSSTLMAETIEWVEAMRSLGRSPIAYANDATGPSAPPGVSWQQLVAGFDGAGVEAPFWWVQHIVGYPGHFSASNILHSGYVAPSTTYTDGDQYLNTATGDIYVQLSSAWVFLYNLPAENVMAWQWAQPNAGISTSPTNPHYDIDAILFTDLSVTETVNAALIAEGSGGDTNTSPALFKAWAYA